MSLAIFTSIICDTFSLPSDELLLRICAEVPDTVETIVALATVCRRLNENTSYEKIVQNRLTQKFKQTIVRSTMHLDYYDIDLNLRDSPIWGLAKTRAMASPDEVPTQEDDSFSVNTLGHIPLTSLIPRL